MNIAFIFPGYGSQFVGMGKELYDASRLMQENFEEASTCLNINFVKLCFASSEAELRTLSNAYVAIFLTSISIAQILREKGMVPTVVAGYGIGEYAALNLANSLSMPDGLYFLSKYAQFYHEYLVANTIWTTVSCHGVKLASLKKILKDFEELSIASYNVNNEFLLSVPRVEMEDLKKRIKSVGGAIKELPGEFELQNVTLQPIVEQLKVYLEKVDFNDASIPCIMAVDGKSVIKGRMIRDRVMKQIVSPLRWDKVVNNLQNCDVIIEIGPGSDLSRSLKDVYPDKKIVSVNTPADVEALVESFQIPSSELNTVESE